MYRYLLLLLLFVPSAVFAATSVDVVIVGGTPGGIMAAISAAKEGKTSVLVERTSYVGGLPANGLGATDIHTRGATWGLFGEFVNRIHQSYVDEYGEDSQQVRDCSHGYHFEPHVALDVFTRWLDEHGDRITLLLNHQFDALPSNVVMEENRLRAITITNRGTGEPVQLSGRVFIDATYEGDLAAAAGASYRLGREGTYELDEPMAGRLYKAWRGDIGEGSSGLADNAVQAYNFRLCMTNDPDKRVLFPKPESYDRSEFVSLIDDIKQNRLAGIPAREVAFNGMGRLTNMVKVPNRKFDANNQHMAFLSTDLPEENWPWPTAGWDWRDQYAKRLRDYTLGLMWFAQNDPEVPQEFRERCREWGMANDEYVDNGYFPRQVYVREGRRIEGEYLFTAHDALPVRDGARPPLHADSITASHYALDSHAVRKREPGRVHLDGFFSHGTQPYTVPYGVMVPKGVDGLLTPVPVSGTHVGFSTLRMEPCWMALGQAAGIAASVSIDDQVPPREVSVSTIQSSLLDESAVLIYFRDCSIDDPQWKALQFFALRGFFPIDAWEARLDETVSVEQGERWLEWSGVQQNDSCVPGQSTRREFLQEMYDHISEYTFEEQDQIRGEA